MFNSGIHTRTKRPDSDLLRALRDDDFSLIERHLAPEVKERGERLYNSGDDMAKVYFPLGNSLVSYRVPMRDGRGMDTLYVGKEGAVGGIETSGSLAAYCWITVKHGGEFLCVPANDIQSMKEQSIAFQRLFARYAECVMAQIFQTMACNALHTIEQRLAKWLLTAIDRASGAPNIHLTQEQLASLLGVGRSYASRVIQDFKSDGILATTRGALIVKDKNVLANRACDCDEIVKKHFFSVLKGLYHDRHLLK